ncbi:MAG TPA: DUF4340 domain-containing protein [Spirochaetota bacterium]|nr:DUF4340 domain-containing protein [Spirochaetota bacterium]
MSRNTIISFGVVGLLALVILVQNVKFGNDIPKLKQWIDPADSIEVKSKDYSMRLYMKEGAWMVNDEAYPADENSAGNLEMKVRDIRLTDLVSEEKSYDRYELTDEKAVTVTVRKGEAVLRTLVIGKAGGKSSHAFVRIDSRPEVYLAAGIQREEFTPSLDSMRDKRIFDLKGKEVESFTLSSGGRTYSFYKKTVTPEKAGADVKPDTSWYCKGYDAKPLDEGAVSSILYVFSPLRAVNYPENKKPDELGRLYASAVIKSGGVDYDVKIFSGREKEYNYAVSSKSQYIFTMGDWQTEKLVIKNIKDLMKK